MPPSWTAEIDLTPEFARALIERQFPHLAPARVTLLGVGWDNAAFRVNDAYVFRFPRRQFAAPFLDTEMRLLPALAPRLPLPIPCPAFCGQPDTTYPWTFAGYPMLPGRTACTADLSHAQRLRAAEPLARFLAILHAVPAQEAARHGAPQDTIRRLDLAHRLPRAHALLSELAARGLIADAVSLREILAAAPPGYTPRADTLVHGDLYARHLLVDDTGNLSGVIDWGDLHVGDPALDLALVHTFLPPAARELFFRVYGEVSPLTWRIARLRAVWHTLILVDYSDQVGDAALMREAQQSLRFVCSDA